MQGLWRNAAVAVALVLAVAFGINRLPQGDRTVRPAPQSDVASAHVVWSHGRDGAAQNAQEHWQKHGDEFPEFRSAREYEDGALRFVTNPPPGTLTKANDRGDTLYYDPATNTFAVKDRRGEPRTFFRPDDGRAYWDRQ
jgi:pyocin large subunit-like protein